MTESFIPMSSIVMAGVTIALLVLSSLAGFLFVRKRVAGLGNALISGLLAGAAFNIVAPNIISLGLSFIPGVSEFMTENTEFQSVISLLMKIVFEFLAVVIGYIILKRNVKRNHFEIGLGEMLAFGVGLYIVVIFMGSLFSYLTDYISNATYINSVGYDAAVQYFLENAADYTEEQIVTAFENLASQKGFDFIAAGLVLIFNGVVDICMCVCFYGIRKQILEKKFLGLFFGELLLYEIPNAISVFADISELVYMIGCLVAAAAVAFATYYIIRTYMLKEWDDFFHKKNGPRPAKKDEPKKMPKIVMPD